MAIKDKIRSAFGLDDDFDDDEIPRLSNADIYLEREPTIAEFFEELMPTWQGVGAYLYNLLPFLQWIGKYNVTWLVGDLIAGNYRSQKVTKTALTSSRYHCWRCRCSSEHGLRPARPASCRIWSLLVLHGRSYLLVLCYFQGYHHRRKYLNYPIILSLLFSALTS